MGVNGLIGSFYKEEREGSTKTKKTAKNDAVDLKPLKSMIEETVVDATKNIYKFLESISEKLTYKNLTFTKRN